MWHLSWQPCEWEKWATEWIWLQIWQEKVLAVVGGVEEVTSSGSCGEMEVTWYGWIAQTGVVTS